MTLEANLRGDRTHLALFYQDLGAGDYDTLRASHADCEVLDPGSDPGSPRYMRTKKLTLADLGDNAVFEEDHFDLLSLSTNYLQLQHPDPRIGDEPTGEGKDSRTCLHDTPFFKINYYQTNSSDSEGSVVTKVVTIRDLFFPGSNQGVLHRFGTAEGAFSQRASAVTSMTFNVRGNTGAVHLGEMKFKHFRHDDGFGPIYFPLRSPLQLSGDREAKGNVVWGGEKGFEYEVETLSSNDKPQKAYKYLPSGDRDGPFTFQHLPNTRFTAQFTRTEPDMDLPLTLQVERDLTNPLFVSAFIESKNAFPQQLEPFAATGETYDVGTNNWLSGKSSCRVTFQAHSTVPGKYGTLVGEPVNVTLIDLAQKALRQAEGMLLGHSTLSDGALRLRVTLTPSGVGEVEALAGAESTCAAITRLATGGEPPFHYGETYLYNHKKHKLD